MPLHSFVDHTEVVKPPLPLVHRPRLYIGTAKFEARPHRQIQEAHRIIRSIDDDLVIVEQMDAILARSGPHLYQGAHTLLVIELMAPRDIDDWLVFLLSTSPLDAVGTFPDVTREHDHVRIGFDWIESRELQMQVTQYVQLRYNPPQN